MKFCKRKPMVVALAIAFFASMPGAFAQPNDSMHNSRSPYMDFLYWGDVMLRAGMMDSEEAVMKATAAKGVFDGTYVPTVSYKPSSKVETDIEGHFVDFFTKAGDFPGGRPAAERYVKARVADYEADASAHGDAPNDFASACEYFAATAVSVQTGLAVSAADRRALHGACVVQIAEYQAVKKLTEDEQRQTISDALVLIAGSTAEQYRQQSSSSGRANLKALMAKNFQSFTGVPLETYPLDHIACAGANDEKSRAVCLQIPNSKLAEVSTRAH